MLIEVIKDLIAREILDSRGNPTVEVDLILDNNKTYRASVPSGASAGSREALELRDKDERYHGKGVRRAVNNVNNIIKPAIIGKKADVVVIDRIMQKIDGTTNKSTLGANATLAVSLATLKAACDLEGKELWEYLSTSKVSLPIPMMNVINGGAHADSGLAIQEFMIVPVVPTFKERLRVGSEVFHTLKDILKKDGYHVAVGDEGGFAPSLRSTEDALVYIVKAINESGYVPGKDVFIALDVAASEIYNENTNTYRIDNRVLSARDLLKFYSYIVDKYPIISIEDPFDENDFESFQLITKLLGNKIMLVGDDYFVTNSRCLQKGIDMGAGNAIIIKANQIGTVSETIETLILAKKNKYVPIISHRSGETEDTFISDFAVGLSIPYIKTGSLSRGERIAKYNQLLRIEEKLLRK
ncbi:MAG: phosphopyruvate hydratase [Bacilli bacterium]|nr:phosphopyruvate hydratase [Bacilli bacterium]